MNQTTIAGHLGADPEVRFTSSGKKVTNLRVAARVRRGTKEDITIWWRVTFWSEDFDKIISYMKKGSAVVIVGEMNKPEIFTDREGKPQISMSMTGYNVSFSPFGGKAEGGQTESTGTPAAAPSSSEPSFGLNDFATHAAPRAGGSLPGNFSEDEIPF